MTSKKKDWQAVLKDKIALIGFVIAIAVVSIGIGTLTGVSPFSPSATIKKATRDQAQNSSNESIIKNSVDYAKQNSTFPMKLDEITTFTDITAEPNAIRYHYLIKGADTTSISENVLKKNLLPATCNNDSAKEYLGRNINLEYLYTVSETSEDFLVIIQESDCS